MSTAPCLFPMSLNFFFSFRAVMCNLFPGRRSTYPPGLATGLAGSSVDVCVGVRAMSSWSIRTSSAEEFLPHKYRVWLIQVATKFTAALTALSVTTVEGSKSDSPDEKYRILACKRDATLSCKTEKDRDARQRKNDRCAGKMQIVLFSGHKPRHNGGSPCGHYTP